MRKGELAKVLLAGRKTLTSVSVCLSALGEQGGAEALPFPPHQPRSWSLPGEGTLHCLGAKTGTRV